MDNNPRKTRLAIMVVDFSFAHRRTRAGLKYAMLV